MPSSADTVRGHAAVVRRLLNLLAISQASAWKECCCCCPPDGRWQQLAARRMSARQTNLALRHVGLRLRTEKGNRGTCACALLGTKTSEAGALCRLLLALKGQRRAGSQHSQL